MIFAKVMEDKKDFAQFWKKALNKYRLVIMTDDSFEEKLSIKLSRLNIFSFLGFVIIFCCVAAILLVTNTPLKEYVPGKETSEVQRELIEITIKSDSLLNALETQKKYLKNIRNIIHGGDLIAPEIINPSNNDNYVVSFKKSTEDSLLRIAVESEDKGSIISSKSNDAELILFFSPIHGVITDKFDASKKHFGVDLVGAKNEKISAVLGGTVIISHWTPETGYVIGIQHKNEYVSLYKHNSVLLKVVGDFINAGDPIAIIGNSGEFSSGPHLHFELWHQGIALDPENYILF